ncbi:hypothetical protein GCM10011390_41160 [Aureimonas endophytica]|uniref:Tellurite resistance protein TerB n=1 Tax=Aureimonas endophytica TaxID=2027858 RepID=A0A916ZXF6_9HYPH|nr:hypothetical protein [Aureimonas endophytica]GGE17765.1 hypothetical protein GCM10011390_41160 [Aureimonas endophytica]
MHILAILIGILGGVAVWYWRMRAVGLLASDIGEAALRLRGRLRRGRFRRKVEAATLAGIDDPRLGAGVMLVAFVEAGQPMTPDDAATIKRWLRDVTGEERPDEVLAFAHWANREAGGVDPVFRRLMPLFRQCLDPSERAQLVDMAASLVRTEPQARVLRRMERALLPDRTSQEPR